MVDQLSHCEIRESTYQGWRSFEMNSMEMQIIVIPELGGKIVSLQYLPTEKEWLVDAGSRGLHKVPYSSIFTDAEYTQDVFSR